MDHIVIIGSSGHAKVIIDIVERAGKFKLVGLLDRFRSMGEETMGYPILGREEDLPKLIGTHNLRGALIAIGDNYVRATVVARVKEISPSLPFISAIHPSSSVATDVTIGEGTVVMAGASINPGSSIGQFCILNTNSSLDHDSIMADFASLAPGAITGGHCQIGQGSAISIGATLINGITVGEHTVVGAGSVVLKSIEAHAVAYGCPAKVVRNRKPGDKYL